MIPRLLVLELLKALNGAFFTVTFKKVDGSERVLKAHIDEDKATIHGTKALSKDTAAVWDVEAKGFRSFRLDSVIRITVP